MEITPNNTSKYFIVVSMKILYTWKCCLKHIVENLRCYCCTEQIKFQSRNINQKFYGLVRWFFGTKFLHCIQGSIWCQDRLISVLIVSFHRLNWAFNGLHLADNWKLLGLFQTIAFCSFFEYCRGSWETEYFLAFAWRRKSIEENQFYT